VKLTGWAGQREAAGMREVDDQLGIKQTADAGRV
jgi:hypothetical protein